MAHLTNHKTSLHILGHDGDAFSDSKTQTDQYPLDKCSVQLCSLESAVEDISQQGSCMVDGELLYNNDMSLFLYRLMKSASR